MQTCMYAAGDVQTRGNVEDADVELRREEHPFRTAWRTRDLEQWLGALAPDVVLHSPLIRATFEGRPAAERLYSVLFKRLGTVDIVDELEDGRTAWFSWRTDIRGTTVDGGDLITSDPSGAVLDIRVFVRPLVGLAAFTEAIGPDLARTNGRVHGHLVTAISPAARAAASALDIAVTALVRPGGGTGRAAGS
jgi:ketosteroid isomerase-like protein